MISKEFIIRLIKFGTVGALGTIVNEALFFIFSKLFPVLLSLLLAIELSILFNFMLNDIWTFRDRRAGRLIDRLVRFHIAAIVGGLIQYLVVITLIVIGWQNQALAILFSSYSRLPTIILIINLVGILVAFVVRFLLSYKFVWARF